MKKLIKIQGKYYSVGETVIIEKYVNLFYRRWTVSKKRWEIMSINDTLHTATISDGKIIKLIYESDVNYGNNKNNEVKTIGYITKYGVDFKYWVEHTGYEKYGKETKFVRISEPCHALGYNFDELIIDFQVVNSFDPFELYDFCIPNLKIRKP